MLVLLAAIAISAKFEGGNSGKVEQVTATHFRCLIEGQVDQDQRNRQANWYYFRVDGARGKQVTIDLVNLPGEYNYLPNRGAVTKDTVPVVSDDDKAWRFADKVEYDAAEPRLRIRLNPTGNRIWIAHTPPYTNKHLDRLLRESKRSPHFASRVIGKSVENRPLYLWTVTDSSAAVAESGKKVIWLMARQHSWETFTSWVLEGALRHLLADGKESRRLRKAAIRKILPAGDPDGLAHGGVRFNRNGFDLNRNWDAKDAEKMPEITAQRGAILAWVDAGKRIDLFLSMHNTETAEYLEGPPDGFGGLAIRLFGLLRAKAGFSPSRALSFAAVTTTEGKQGRMNVVQGLWRDRKLPAFLTEQRVSAQPGSGRLLNVEDRMEYGRKLASAMLEAVRNGEE